MSIIELTDLKVTPDIVHEYASSTKEGIAIVIDNGSCKCRVGWSNRAETLLEFRNLLAKPRKERKKEAEVAASQKIQIGNDIVNIEAMRMQLKTQFDRNVVVQYHTQERIFDYIFSHLGITHDGCVPHPIVLTEALVNPAVCRGHMSELLFECYGVPGLSYGVDALFSWQHHKRSSDALIISLGYHTTSVIPVLEGALKVEHSRRLNIGGYHIITFLYRLMQLKYPTHISAITLSRIETLLHQHCRIATDYLAELQLWAHHDFYERNVLKIQLPYTVPAPTVCLTPEQKLERRKELTQRLMEVNLRRAKEKEQEYEKELQRMQNIRKLHETGHSTKLRIALAKSNIPNVKELDVLIADLRARLARMKEKPFGSGGSSREKAPNIAKPPAGVPLKNWLVTIKEKREQVLQRQKLRRSRRQDLAKRRTAAAQERMRIISHLARNEKGSDEFGKDDKDWDVYKVINRDQDGDSDAENEAILECENILRHYDPKYEETEEMPDVSAENFQLHFGVEQIRAPELLFQPSMMGSSEAGLSELIAFVLKHFDTNEQQRLANNVYLTGGCAQFTGLTQRLSKDLTENRPFNTPHSIYKATEPELDAWWGAWDFANSAEFKQFVTTKADYEEHGAQYFKRHPASNV